MDKRERASEREREKERERNKDVCGQINLEISFSVT